MILKQLSKDVRDGLRLVGWSHSEIDSFIERFPCIWLQCLQSSGIFDAVGDIEVFVAYESQA